MSGTSTPGWLPPLPRRGLRFWASPAAEPRARRATDVLQFALGAVVFGAVAFVAVPPSGFEQALIDLVASLPGFLESVWQFGWDLLPLWALVLLGMSLGRRRFAVARDLCLASLVALATTVVTARILSGDWPDVWSGLGAHPDATAIPAWRLAAAAAAVLAVRPHLSRPFRAYGRWIVGYALVSAVVLALTTPSGGLGGLLAALVGAAAVHLVFGSTAGRPGLTEVRAALDELGVATTALEGAARQDAGVFTVRGTDDEGAPLLVKVYGRDAWDTQLLAKVWRSLWYRESESSLTLTRLQQVEHEAFVTLLAASRGIPVPEVVTAGRDAAGDALLVLRGGFRSFADGPDAVDDSVLQDAWDVVARVHAAGLAHGHLDAVHLGIDGTGRVALLDLGGAVVGAPAQLEAVDRAQMLVTSAVLVGSERAVAAAVRALGTHGLAETVPFVQEAVLQRTLRAAAKTADVDVDELRNAAAHAATVEEPELARLRRITAGMLVRASLLALAAWALISALGDLSLDELVSELDDASWPALIFGFLFGQIPRFAQALSTLGAAPLALPYGPVYALQLAISFVNLAIPSSAARVAVNVRFFQRQGIPAAQAVTVGAIDGFSGFVVQVLILLLTIAFGFSSVDYDLQLDGGDGIGSGGLILAVLVAVVVGVAVVLLVPRFRLPVVAAVRRWSAQAWEALRNLRSPVKLLQLFGGNLLSEVLFAVTLGIFVAAFGVTVPLMTLLTVNVIASLFAGVMPVPGGIGVTEGALIAGLTAAGVPQSVAFAAVISYRLAIFYLPPIWGAVAFRWLERNRYL